MRIGSVWPNTRRNRFRIGCKDCRSCSCWRFWWPAHCCKGNRAPCKPWSDSQLRSLTGGGTKGMFLKINIIWSKCPYNFPSPKKYDLLKTVITGCMIDVNIFEEIWTPNDFLKKVGLRRACILDSISQLDHACIIIEILPLGLGEHCTLSASFWTFAGFPRSWTQASWRLTSLLCARKFLTGLIESTQELPVNK